MAADSLMTVTLEHVIIFCESNSHYFSELVNAAAHARTAGTEPPPMSRAPTKQRQTAPQTSQGGFTLLETSIVVFIVGLLLTFGIPTFLGARTSAHDLDAKASLRTAFVAGLTISDFRSDFRSAADDDLSPYEPSLAFVDEMTPSTGPKVISIDASASDRWVAVARSESGTCFAVVVGPFGQTGAEPSSCVASDVTVPPPAPSFREVVHTGPVTAVTAGMCLEVVEGFLEQQPCSATQAPLMIETGPDGYSTLSLSDGSCFGTTGPVKAAQVIEEICEESDDQLWTVIPSYDGTVQFKNKETGYCLDVYGASASPGADLIQWGYGDPPNGTCKPTTSANNHNFGYG